MYQPMSLNDRSAKLIRGFGSSWSHTE